MLRLKFEGSVSVKDTAKDQLKEKQMGGFNLPPGCSVSDLPGNGPEYCDLCGVWDLDLCICPECPECGEVGNIKCYPAHGLTLSQAQLRGAAAFQEAERKAIEQEQAYWEEYREEMNAWPH